MTKTTCVILGLAFLAMGILGITGLVPMFTSDLIYVNIGEIVLGGLGLLVGIYAGQTGKTVCVILGLAFLAKGILGITGLVPIFTSNLIFVNIGEIILGGLGLIVGIYAGQIGKNEQQRKDSLRQTQDNDLRQRKENELLRKENEQRQKDNDDRQQQEIEQLRKKNEQQQKNNDDRQQQEIEQLRKQTEQQQKDNDDRQQQEIEQLRKQNEQQKKNNEQLRKQDN